MGVFTKIFALFTVVSIGAFQSFPISHNPFRTRFSSRFQLSAETAGNVFTDKIAVKKFHHVEFYCGDATNAYKRFLVGLGMEFISKSDQSTGNIEHASYVLRSGDMNMIFTAPYSVTGHSNANSPSSGTDSGSLPSNTGPFPGFNNKLASDFFQKHGLGVKSVAVEVEDVTAAYNTMMLNNAVSALKPIEVHDKNQELGSIELAEVVLYGDVVFRILSTKKFKGNFLPNFQDVAMNPDHKMRKFDYGIKKFDHIVGNLFTLQPTMDHIKNITGFHDFAEFTAAVVGTVDSGLNSVVLANNNEMVLLPLNEPTYGTKRKSQIQTYLEQNQGEGVQHMALFTSDIFNTLTLMRDASFYGGFEFMDRQPDSYYDNLPARLGDSLSAEQYENVRRLGLLADKDDQGVLLQIFTKPVGDRPTLFLEIIQRLGCLQDNGDQKPGCGGFGKGNFKDLFRSIEDYEKTLAV